MKKIINQAKNKLTFVFSAIALLLFSSCLKEDNFKNNYEGFAPTQLNDGWQISTPEAENMDKAMLEQAYKDVFYSEKKLIMGEALLVFRNGKLVAEAYAKDPAERNRFHNIQSCTKSVTSLLTGIALKQNLFENIEVPLYSIYPEHFDEDERKRTITLRNALSMRTGLEFDNGQHTQVLYSTEKSSVAYVLKQEYQYPAGMQFSYNDGAPHLVSAAIQKKTGVPLDEFARKNLFEPLGIQHWQWERAKDGVTFGAFSLYLKPRDFGKIGQLCLQKGSWGNKQLFDSTWLAEATQIQANNAHSSNYGLYFWIFPAYKSFAAEGHGGQYLFIIPEKQLVLVYTAKPYTNPDLWGDFEEIASLISQAAK